MKPADMRPMSTNDAPVRDGWVGKFLALRNAAADPKLNRTDLAVLACILDHHGSGGAKPGYQRMSRMTHVDRRTVIRSVQRLQGLGYLTIEGRERQTNIYRPVFPTSVTWPTSGVAVTSDSQTTELVVQVSPPLVGQLSPEPEAIKPEAEPIKPVRTNRPLLTYDKWLDGVSDEEINRLDSKLFEYGKRVDVPEQLIELYIAWVKQKWTDDAKKYKDWPRVICRALEEDWHHLWRFGPDGSPCLTTAGQQLQRSTSTS